MNANKLSIKNAHETSFTSLMGNKEEFCFPHWTLINKIRY